MKKQKVFYDEITFIRAIACLLVLTVHVTASFFYRNNEFTAESLLFFNQLARMGTPIFAIISAFLLMVSVINRGFNINYYIKTRFTKILFPYLIWSLIYILFHKYYFGKEIQFEQSVEHLLYGTAHYHLYFFLAVFQFYLVFPLVQKLSNIPLILFAVVSIIINFIWILNDPIQFNSEFLTNFLYGTRSFILNWIGFFGLGLLMAKYYNVLKSFILNNQYLIIVLFSVAFAETWIIIDSQKYMFSSTRIQNLYLVPLFIAVLFIVYSKVKGESVLIKALNKIGNYSMGIYLIHPLALTFMHSMIVEFYGSIAVIDNHMFIIAFLVVLSLSILMVYLISFIPFSSYIIPIPQRKRPEKQVVLSALHNKVTSAGR